MIIEPTPCIIAFQSTRPRGARRRHSDTVIDRYIVSIHAPARGATFDSLIMGQHKFVSIHAPARGATSRRQHLTGIFQVSIHAPARGATFYLLFFSDFSLVSIHAPARGATHRFYDRFHDREFQSTRPRGARLRLMLQVATIDCFNPRARAGRDIAARIYIPGASLFQSTRPRGARPGPRTNQQ